MGDDSIRVTISFGEDEEYLAAAMQAIAEEEYDGDLTAAYRDLIQTTYVRGNQVQRQDNTYDLLLYRDDETYTFEVDTLYEARQVSDALHVIDTLLEHDPNQETIQDYISTDDDTGKE